MKKKISLPMKILIALILGIVAGFACYAMQVPDFTTNYLKPFGDIFVNLLKFIVVPVVLLSMIDGILSMGDMKKVGSVGVKTLVYFMTTSAIACVIGLVFANIFNSMGVFPKLALEEGAVWDKATSANFMDTIKGIFPSNMWESFHTANMLQVIVIALFFGGAIMAAVLLAKYTLWAVRLPKEDKRLIRRNILSFKSLAALWEVVRESLLHVRIFRVNPVLGYMHSSLALGWLLLIAVGWIETVAYLGLRWVPLQGHVFFKYFMPVNGITQHKAGFELAMDLLLAVVLSGVALAWIKRMRSRIMGLRRTTKHVLFDRIALSALWFVFPLRYLAESVTCAIYGGGSFLTGSTGSLLASHLDAETLAAIYEPLWWCYSIALGIFFSTMPFSRYMHIFTEIPLIFLRRYRLAPGIEPKSYDHFEVEACSRCGICIDPCQLQSVLGIDEVQSVYFLRDRRYNMLQLSVANNCLMCGRCQTKCPVGINLNTLRLNSRSRMRNIPNEGRFNYLSGIDRSSGEGRTGYFAGCMTMLTPRTLSAMDTIFRAAGDDVWHADRDGGVCCGRPLMLSGETTAARKMIEYNTDLFRRHGITRLVTSCPICLRVFREEYALDGIEVMHHSEYIRTMIAEGRLQMRRTDRRYTYHDPCELGRGSGIYDQPRAVIEAVGELLEPVATRENAPCCGSSVANTAIDDGQQKAIARQVATELEATGAEVIVTACPLCKKAIGRGATKKVHDLAEIVADKIRA